MVACENAKEKISGEEQRSLYAWLSSVASISLAGSEYYWRMAA